MKTETLKELGLTEDQIKAVFVENGKDVEAEKQKTAEALKKYESAKAESESWRAKAAELANAKADGDAYKTELEKLRAQIEQKNAEDAKLAAEKKLDEQIAAALADRKFTSEYAKRGLIEDIKAGIASDPSKGVDKLVEELTKDKDGIFASPNPPAKMGGFGGTADAGNITGVEEAFYKKNPGLAPK